MKELVLRLLKLRICAFTVLTGLRSQSRSVQRQADVKKLKLI